MPSEPAVIVPPGAPVVERSLASSPVDVSFRHGGSDPRSLLDEGVLAAVVFGSPAEGDDPRLISVPLSHVGPAPLVEVWRVPDAVVRDIHLGVAVARSPRLLFGHVRGEEGEGADLESITLDCYRRLFAVATELGCPHVFRIWNFFSDINGEEGGLERYRAFCRGRHRALLDVLPDEGRLPAASAIGSRRPGLVLCFLAATEPGLQVENPRQVSAFRYPPAYGPRSPSFSRSMLMDWGPTRQLFVSGTASIVGHASRHPRDVAEQLAETLDNIEALLAAAADRSGSPLRVDLLRLYLRDGDGAGAAHVEALRSAVAQRFGPVPSLVLAGDICRRDLLIEVEGVASAAVAAGPHAAGTGRSDGG